MGAKPERTRHQYGAFLSVQACNGFPRLRIHRVRGSSSVEGCSQIIQLQRRRSGRSSATGQLLVRASLAATLAPTQSGVASRAMAQALVPPPIPVLPCPRSLGAVAGGMSLGDGAVITSVVPDHVTLMRVVGYVVLAGACVRSLPQILRILRAKAATGVSLTSNVAELLAYSITIAYNVRQGYAFSTYGEVVACWIQDVALVALISRFSGIDDWRMMWGAIGFGLFCWWLTSTACTPAILTSDSVLQASTISIIALGGRLPQIVLNVRRKGSGELSMTTCLLNLMGNIARVFTTLVLTQDPLILMGNAVQGTLNSVLLWQTVTTAIDRTRRAKGSVDDTHAPYEERIGLSPAAIEAAEGESEEAGMMGDGGVAPAMGGNGGGDGGDGGGYGGIGSSLFDISPVDLPMGSERKYE